jgi:chromate transport protein ChrA|tara:strand:- start:1287 stop:1742 length:456 start_codon:yes stop_codon:yes gene_type:complete
MKKNSITELFDFLHNHIKRINDSKIFAGLMIITLNIVSRFVTIKLSKSMESYLKYTFSKYLLVFTIAWMGTRDIYIAITIMLIYIIIFDYLLDDDSMFCVLPEEFKSYHQTLLENDGKQEITEDDIKNAEKILEKAKRDGRYNGVEGFRGK